MDLNKKYRDWFSSEAEKLIENKEKCEHQMYLAFCAGSKESPKKESTKINVAPTTCSIWDGKKKCPHAKCKRTPVFAVFTGDGEEMLSRLFTESCGEHLPLAIRKAKKHNEAR